MDILISIGQIIVDFLFVSAFILGVIACVKLAKFDVTGKKNTNKDKLSKKDTEVKDDDIKIEITIKYHDAERS